MQNDPLNPQQPTTPASAPTPPSAVPVSQVPTPPTTNPPASPYTPASPQPLEPPAQPTIPVPQKSNTKLIIGIVAGVVGVALLLFSILVALVALPRIQSAAVASAFMDDITSGDIDGAVKATGDESDRSFLTGAADRLKGSTYTTGDSEYNQSGDSYYLFTLSGGDQKSARVIVGTKDGKRVVTSLVYSTTQLALKPGTASTNTSDNSTDTQSSAKAASACFAPNDYSHALGYSNTLTFNETSPYTTNAHFPADSLQYTDASSQSNVETVATIVTDNPGKDYLIHINGSVATTAASDASFANQRAEKVKNDLVSRGVAAGKIVIDTPQNVNSMGTALNETIKEMARVVVMKLIPACTTDATGSTAR